MRSPLPAHPSQRGRSQEPARARSQRPAARSHQPGARKQAPSVQAVDAEREDGVVDAADADAVRATVVRVDPEEEERVCLVAEGRVARRLLRREEALGTRPARTGASGE